jgi:YYY domain-containing protein
VGLEVAHANGVGDAALWEWLDVRELDNAPESVEPARYETSNWWWWRSSRPLREYHLSGRAEDGLEPIAEFPAFSFILGDMHPHVLALPFAFLSLAVALLWWLPRTRGPGSASPLASWDSDPWTARSQALLGEIGVPLWLLTALILGGLSFLNTWDVLIHLFVVLGAFLLARWRDEGWHVRLLTQTVLVAFLLLIPAVLLYLPFFLGFRSQAGAPYLLPMLMRPTRLAQFLIIFGMPLWAINVFLLALAWRQKFRYWRSGLITAVSLILGLLLLALVFAWIVALSPDGAARVGGLANELGIALPARPEQSLAPGWGVSAVAALLPSYFGARLAYPALTLLLAAMIGLVVMIWRAQLDESETRPLAGYTSVLPFVLLLVGTGALLTLGPEFVFLRDNFGARLNTIFKFYYQAWVMFGVAALFGIGYLWLAWQGRARAAPLVATVGYALALAVGLLFPLYAVNSRAMEYRGPLTAETRLPATLDGLAQTERFNADEYAALQWLRQQVPGTPVILEAVGGQYSAYGRVAAATGLPTVLGWAGHEYQWRGETPEPGEREPAVREIYSRPDLSGVAAFLDRYNVQYIYVGGLERDTYGLAGLDKFAEQLDLAYSNGTVAIYRWQPQ